MAPNNLKNMPPEKKRLLRTVLTATGIIFFMCGMAIVAFPATYGEMIFGDEAESTGRIFGGALVLVGVTDVFIAKILFGESTK